eukprot:8488086-Lingulodinium_polyedra.AAC.1
MLATTAVVRNRHRVRRSTPPGHEGMPEPTGAPQLLRRTAAESAHAHAGACAIAPRQMPGAPGGAVQPTGTGWGAP